MKNYLLYYFVKFGVVYQYHKDFDFLGLDFYQYLDLKLKVYSPSKTRIPALSARFVLFGLGFTLDTHARR